MQFVVLTLRIQKFEKSFLISQSDGVRTRIHSRKQAMFLFVAPSLRKVRKHFDYWDSDKPPKRIKNACVMIAFRPILK